MCVDGREGMREKMKERGGKKWKRGRVLEGVGYSGNGGL